MATRGEDWRQAPARLALGDARATSVRVSAAYSFEPGKRYDLWLTALNSRGTSTVGPRIVRDVA